MGEMPWDSTIFTLSGISPSSGPTSSPRPIISGVKINANYAVSGRSIFDLGKKKISTIVSKYEDLKTIAYPVTVHRSPEILGSDTTETVVFSYRPVQRVGSPITTLHSFNASSGRYPPVS